MSEALGIIGLGRTGLAAAKVYLAESHKVYGYDTDANAVENFRAAGGIVMNGPHQVAANVSILLIMVLNDEQVLDVVAGPTGILAGAKGGTTIICMSTINREIVTTVASKCTAAGMLFLDCPFTGGPARIKARTLTLIAAGHEYVLQNAMPVLEVLGKIVYVGEEPGQAQAVKHCNQLLVGVTHAATMEVITLARRSGLDPSSVISVIASGIAGSDYFRLLSESVLHRSPSPGSLGQMCKDMAIVRKSVDEAGMRGLVAFAASEYFSKALSLGMSEREGADLIEVVDASTTDHQTR